MTNVQSFHSYLCRATEQPPSPCYIPQFFKQYEGIGPCHMALKDSMTSLAPSTGNFDKFRWESSEPPEMEGTWKL